ncbi:sugar ABC transporter permease [Paenibacillus sp. WQ 127069]|jgi:D-xylose transport system permease protein|uniref:Xylose transport system permease protein XylH n=3 Tax=Paenibacillus TaxID=44249 RepID=A0ABT2UC01_9BACL|nr:sugar ABC transporter permease [Paenibacillus sp. WQ 127069]MCU6792155.1 sugar ABC transporter permease [Paenibacillus sp. WQ 127069]
MANFGGMQVPVDGVKNHRKIQLWMKMDIRAYAMIGALVAIWLLFSLLNDTFLTPRNLSNLFLQMSVTSVLAIGMVLVIVAGQIDLSIGSIVGLTGGVAAILNVWYDWSTVPVIIATILLGAVIGFIQGWWVAYRAVPAFIVTLGGMMVFRGLWLGISGSKTIAPLSPGFKYIGQSYLIGPIGLILAVIAIVFLVIGLLRKRNSRKKYGFELEPMTFTMAKAVIYAALILGFVLLMNQYQGIPVPFLIVIVLAVIFTFMAKNTVFGRQTYAVGGNAEASRLSGINTKRRLLVVFVLCNTLAAVAGLILTARLNAATSNAGNMYELDAIAACVIGGTSLLGGAGTIIGAIIGALVMASLDNGMSIMNVDSYWQLIAKGSILVVAVWFDIYSRQKKKKA